MKILSNSKRGGFTLIELLVVIAIIGLLTGIVVANLTTSRAKARDAKRISDLGQIQLALELYFDRCNTYPFDLDIEANTGCTDTITLETFISKIPTDPSYTESSSQGRTPKLDRGGSVSTPHPNYAYYVNNVPTHGGESNVTDYILKAVLETNNEALKDSYDGSTANFYDSTSNNNIPATFDCVPDIDNEEYNYCLVPN